LLNICPYRVKLKSLEVLKWHTAMKVNSQNNFNFTAKAPVIRGVQEFASKTFSKIDEIGEGTNITLDFLGKAVLVPAIIMSASKEDKETKQYSAIKNPIAATIQLALEVPILAIGSKAIESLANKGKLDGKNGDFSYNEIKCKDIFIKNVNEEAQNNENFAKKSKEILENLDKKGLNKKIKQELSELIENSANGGKKALKESLENFDLVHKRLYHLQNRFCFLSAIILTPILCKGEDFLFPKVMSFFKKPKTQKPHRMMSLQQFRNLVRRGANVKTN